jgi:hypothetical protein
MRILSPSHGEEPYVRRNVAYVAGATGIAAIAVGSVFGLRAAVDHRNASTGCAAGPCDPQGAAAQRQEGPATTTSVVSLAAGGALLATAVTLVATQSHPADATTSGRVRLMPSAAPGGAGLTLAGGW